MKKKENTGVFWFISSIFLVTFPSVMPAIINSIANGKKLDLKEVSGNIILLLFSVSASLFILILDIYKQKKGKLVKIILIFSFITGFISFAFYIVFIIKDSLVLTDGQCHIIIFLIVLFSFVGCFYGQKSDEYHNDLIKEMHDNCFEIRKNFISEETNKDLEIIAVEKYDLLCSPDRFKSTKKLIDDK